jgi:hypothetical protein
VLKADKKAIFTAASKASEAPRPQSEQLSAYKKRGAALGRLHPGALAFLDDQEKSFFDQYSDIFYIGAMCLSVLGTAMAAAMARLKRQTAYRSKRLTSNARRDTSPSQLIASIRSSAARARRA